MKMIILQNQCKNCKYFERHTGEYDNKQFGECCNKQKFVYGTSDDNKNGGNNDILFYMDYEWYDASLEVGEDFGCIHFENKEV